jgi:DNA-binding NarL/FixJ family response regulator
MMDGLDGIGFLQAVSADKKYEHIPFIFLTAKTSERDIVNALRLGAIDYIEKPFLINQVLQKVESLLNNMRKQRIALINKAYQSLLDETSSIHVSAGVPNNVFDQNCQRFGLTAREVEIVNLIAKGQPHKIISDNLNISIRTVDKHVSNIFDKVGVSNKVELINKLEAATLI